MDTHWGDTLGPENLGTDLAMSGDGLVLAAGQQRLSNPNSGYTFSEHDYVNTVKVYEWNGDDWAMRGDPIAGPAGSENSQIGWSLSLSDDGSVLAVGSPWFEIHSAHRVGEARVYAWNGTEWAQRGGDLPLLLGQSYAFQDFQDAFDRFGYSMSLSGDGTIVAAGVRGRGGWQGGSHVHIYQWQGGPEWVPYGALSGYPKASIQRSPDLGDEDDLHSVRLTRDGRTLVVGWAGSTTVTGSSTSTYTQGRCEVGVYDALPIGHAGVKWVLRGDFILGQTADENSGSAVSVSDNGNIVAIGSPYATGVGGNGRLEVGRARVFTWDGTAWAQLGATINGIDVVNSPDAISYTHNLGEQFGYDVELSANGDVLAVSAPAVSYTHLTLPTTPYV